MIDSSMGSAPMTGHEGALARSLLRDDATYSVILHLSGLRPVAVLYEGPQS
jgi:hypothetical protein